APRTAHGARSLSPVCNKDVRVAFFGGVAIGRKRQLLAVEREHRTAVEQRAERHLLEARAVKVDEKDVEVAAAWVLHVRREDDLLSVGREERRKARAPEVRDLLDVAAVAIHHEDLE